MIPRRLALAALLAGAAALPALPAGVARGQAPPPPPRFRPRPPAVAAPAPAPPAPPQAATPAAPAPPKRVPVHARPKPPPPPPGPAPDVKLAIETPSLNGPWLMRVTNAGDVPVRLVADARLLVLELTPRSASKPVRCELPADMRPADDMERPLVLPPGKSYAETFEPRLYCFAGRAADALSQGTSVVARLGWTTGNKAHPPYVVGPIDGIEPVVAPLKSIDSSPVALPDDVPPPTFSMASAGADDPDRTNLELRAQAYVDAGSPAGLGMNVTLHNAGKRAVVVRFRPESLRFAVTAPTGSEDCRWPTPPVAAMRELYSTIPPGGNASLDVDLSAYCSSRPFDAPGLLVITPRLDTRRSSGAEIGLRTFDGEVVATRPTLVRLHRGLQPQQLVRPRVEGTP